MLYFHSWSGGKDSTASIILDHIHSLPPSTIIFSEVMFDKNRRISGELPEHIDFIFSKAIPLFKSWGYEVKVLHSDFDYLDIFNHVLTRSSYPERIGKKHGFLIAGKCAANPLLKVRPIHNFYKSITSPYIQYLGIAIDEPLRLERLRGTNKTSLLERFHYTEKMAFDLCKKYNLLSPIYDISSRGGCWFCPNQSFSQFAYLKRVYPYLWSELRNLSFDSNLVSDRFRYSDSFSDVESKVDLINDILENESLQLSFF